MGSERSDEVPAFTPYTLRPTPSIAALPQKRSLTY